MRSIENEGDLIDAEIRRIEFLTSKPNSRHIFNITEFSRKISPVICAKRLRIFRIR